MINHVESVLKQDMEDKESICEVVQKLATTTASEDEQKAEVILVEKG